jgi:uncharacterized protein YidB (DUF937 family)
MGLLDGLLGAVMGGGGQTGGGGIGAMLPVLLQSFGGQTASGQQAGGGMAGGLAGLVQQFQQAGLGQQVQSWVGHGQNEPVNGEQVQQALGPQLDGIAAKTGLPVAALVGMLTQALPTIIDQMTPHGRLPNEAEAQQHAAALGAGDAAPSGTTEI